MPYFVFTLVSVTALLFLFWAQWRLHQLRIVNLQCMLEAKRLAEKLQAIADELEQTRQEVQKL